MQEVKREKVTCKIQLSRHGQNKLTENKLIKHAEINAEIIQQFRKVS